MKIFGFSPPLSLIDEIVLWRRVQFIDISKEILYSTNAEMNIYENVLIWHLFEYIFEEEDANEAIYIKSGYLFDKTLQFDDVIGPDGQYQIYSKGNGYEKFIKYKLMEFRRQKLDSKQYILPVRSKYQLRNAKSGYSCSIHVRKELAFSRLLKQKQQQQHPMVNNLSVALLVPSKNSMGNVEECALVKYLLKSLLNNLESRDSIDVVIYVGYDRLDPILSNYQNHKWIENLTGARLKIKFIEIPSSGWLTFIWNVLFVEAYNDPIGNDYFIQLNDDVNFLSKGWLKSSINMMKNDSSIKVIGFHDAKWQCKLYTQTLVDRSHYTTFNGHYFPLELRNWYSDNWITSVYTDQGKCNTNAKISNGNIDTRYENCSDREYRRLVSWENKLNE